MYLCDGLGTSLWTLKSIKVNTATYMREMWNLSVQALRINFSVKSDTLSVPFNEKIVGIFSNGGKGLDVMDGGDL